MEYLASFQLEFPKFNGFSRSVCVVGQGLASSELRTGACSSILLAGRGRPSHRADSPGAGALFPGTWLFQRAQGVESSQGAWNKWGHVSVNRSSVF